MTAITKEVKITKDSIRTELRSYKDKPYQCLFEYIWNSFDAGANVIDINYSLPNGEMGYIEDLKILDNGRGWKFEEDENTATFLASTKSETNSKSKSLPKGKLGRGRFVFIWLSEKIEVFSGNKKIALNHDANYKQEDTELQINGTEIHFINSNENLSSAIKFIDEFKKQLILTFGWLLKQNSTYQIKINGEVLDIDTLVKEQKTLSKYDFSDEVQNQLDDDFSVEIVLWKEKLSEWSNFYFLDNNRNEIFKSGTGLNKQSDNFWHSVYIRSNLFSDENLDQEDSSNLQMDFGDSGKKRLKNKIIREIKEKLVYIRKPYLITQANEVIEDLKDNELLPNLYEYGVYDTESYTDLLKTIYTISPSLFAGKNDAEKRFICATFAGLLSSQDNHLIQIILDQLQKLTDEEKEDLLDILERTTLSNMVKTIKEIDRRLEVIDKLQILISEYEAETLEVKHLQKVLDENFWIFGEQFRLFSSTEGALKNVLVKYAKDILEIEDPELTTQPTGEVDLFLVHSEEVNDIHKNIIVELKRASISLKEDVEYRQIKQYCKKILEQALCNGNNQYWEFYLIGKSYDDGISGLINSAANRGEKQRGLVYWDQDGRVKIYVRKWSDILITEWGNKMKYLKEKLEIKAKSAETTPGEIVEDLTNA